MLLRWTWCSTGLQGSNYLVQKAVDKNKHAFAQKMMGLMYQCGLGVEKNDSLICEVCKSGKC